MKMKGEVSGRLHRGQGRAEELSSSTRYVVRALYTFCGRVFPFPLGLFVTSHRIFNQSLRINKEQSEKQTQRRRLSCIKYGIVGTRT
jgi:hypothetical protein